MHFQNLLPRRSIMSTEKLYEFLVLSKTLNYSKAAEILYISQPVLSLHIQEMEKELNTKLFQRTTHGVALTQAGFLLSSRASRLINKCYSAANISQTADLALCGFIRIACALELSYASHIQIFVSRFMERYPNIKVSFQVLSEGTPDNMLYEQRYDFIFTPCEYVNPPSNIHVHLIQEHGVYAALYAGHPLLSQSSLQLRNLERETLLVPFIDELFGPYAKNLVLAQKYTHNKIRCVSVPNLPTALFELSLGHGIALVPRYVKNMISGNLFLVGISNQSCRFNEYLYYRETPENNAAKLFYKEFCSFFSGYLQTEQALL